MKVVRVGGVEEHFNYPWRLGKSGGTFEKNGIDVQWHSITNGTGAMITALVEDEVDVIVALTEGLVSVRGSDIRILGTYVQSPLRWGVFTGTGSQFKTIDDLKGHTFAISRNTSGSHLMAGVLATSRGWSQEDISFKVTGPFNELRASVNNGDTAAFMWEYFTTKPFVDSGEVRLIGEITTPWSCFMIAARKQWIETSTDTITKLYNGLLPAVQQFHSTPGMEGVIATEYGLKPEDAKAWYEAVKITGSPEVEKSSLRSAVDALFETKVIPTKDFDIDCLVASTVCKLVGE